MFLVLGDLVGSVVGSGGNPQQGLRHHPPQGFWGLAWSDMGFAVQTLIATSPCPSSHCTVDGRVRVGDECTGKEANLMTKLP